MHDYEFVQITCLHRINTLEVETNINQKENIDKYGRTEELTLRVVILYPRL